MSNRKPFNRYNTAVMLVALTKTENESVAEKARKLLEAPNLETACLEAVERGMVGGFLTAVIEGDFINAFILADGHNRKALYEMLELPTQFGGGLRDTLDDE